MTDGIEAVTRSALSLALDAASLRQQAIATNIANANASGFVPRRVSFEDQLTDARRSMAQTGEIDAFALSHVRPRIEAATEEAVLDSQVAASEVRLDVQAADMARNAVHFQALAKGLARHYAILSMAVGDGRK